MAISLPSLLREQYLIGQFLAKYVCGICFVLSALPLAYINHYLDMLPNIRFRVDNTHVRLISASIYEDPVIHLQECISGIILLERSKQLVSEYQDNYVRGRVVLWQHSLQMEWRIIDRRGLAIQ